MGVGGRALNQSGRPRVGLNGQGWEWRAWYRSEGFWDVEGMRYVKRALGRGWVLKALMGMEGIRCVGMGWNGCEGPLEGEGVLELIWKV